MVAQAIGIRELAFNPTQIGLATRFERHPGPVWRFGVRLLSNHRL